MVVKVVSEKKITDKYYFYKKVGHMKRCCPEKNNDNDENNDVNNLVIQLIGVEHEDDIVRVNNFEIHLEIYQGCHH